MRYKGHAPQFKHGTLYVARVTHYYLGTHVKVEVVHGYDDLPVKGMSEIYESPTTFARFWDVKSEFDRTDQAPKRRKRGEDE
jgi:hypothetical protein